MPKKGAPKPPEAAVSFVMRVLPAEDGRVKIELDMDAATAMTMAMVFLRGSGQV